MKSLLDMSKVSNGRPNKCEVARREWKRKEMLLIGVRIVYDSDKSRNKISPVMVEFESMEEYIKAKNNALEYLDRYEQIPYNLRSRLIKETDNLAKQGLIDF